MNPESRRWAYPMAAWAIGLICALAPVANAAADELKAWRGTNAAWSGECGGCHLPYPPQLLPAGSWRALMQGLDQHFGTDASVDPKTAATIGAFLEANAGRERSGKPEAAVLRITATRWFGHEHSGKAAATWKAGWIKSPADCAACHRQAANGDFGERTLRLPQ